MKGGSVGGSQAFGSGESHAAVVDITRDKAAARKETAQGILAAIDKCFASEYFALQDDGSFKFRKKFLKSKPPGLAEEFKALFNALVSFTPYLVAALPEQHISKKRVISVLNALPDVWKVLKSTDECAPGQWLSLIGNVRSLSKGLKDVDVEEECLVVVAKVLEAKVLPWLQAEKEEGVVDIRVLGDAASKANSLLRDCPGEKVEELRSRFNVLEIIDRDDGESALPQQEGVRKQGVEGMLGAVPLGQDDDDTGEAAAHQIYEGGLAHLPQGDLSGDTNALRALGLVGLPYGGVDASENDLSPA